ncbi:phosphotransferase [Jiangella anatolica]|uniref:Serine/threonine protein kinase n=1 Tax=Jiangella anatolica TaxID=2670374 RepID=A0A2W2C288_9ACTN|nr:phosphotransferase [Jiangella anatolica]PZF86218.1 serine/threonine protein kinase [Jiangella anatolica]
MELIGSGRTADVYAIGDDRVLRRYRDGGSAVAEAAVMEHVRAHGVPVPAVHDVTGPDLVLDRLTGPTLLQAALRGDRTADDVAGVLAGLHHRLHAVPPSGHPRPVAPADGAAATVIHLDLHPDNVLLTASGPVLIDWRNATDGPGDLDVAYSALILAQVAVDPGAGPQALAAALIEPFLTMAGGAPLRYLETATARRGADPMMSATELDRLGAAAALVARTAR